MAYKTVPVKTTVSSAIDDAFGVFEELAGEMRETYDNMEGANMGHMDKCVRAGEAADELDNHNSAPDVADHLGDLPVETTEQVNKDKRKGSSRSVRLANAQALIQGAIDALENYHPEADLDPEDSDAKVDEKEDAAEGLKEEAESLVSELQEHADFDVDFPGMFG